MLSTSERDLLQRREARVFEVLDYATKPAQWIIGGVHSVLLLLILAGACIVTPIYYLLHGGTFSTVQFVAGCAIIGFLVILFAAPYYFVLAGAMAFGYLMYVSETPNGEFKSVIALCLWECVGLLHVGLKVRRWFWKRRVRSAPMRMLRDAWAEFNRGNADQADKILFDACMLAFDLHLPEDHRYWCEALALERALGTRTNCTD